jgi:hypothetical protein
MSEAVSAQSAGLWKDWRYYTAWWAFWTALFSLLQPDYVGDDGFWIRKAITLVAGICYGVALGSAFTMEQNVLNKTRRKPISWIFAIVTAIAGKALTVAVMAS